jgi:hypothetical protein
MAVAEELQILVDAKVSAAVRDLKKVQKESDNLGGSFKKLGTIAKQFLPAVGIASVVVATKQLITLASAADESANAVNVTFGEAADTISDFGDTAANVVGLSKTDFSELATVIGAQLKQAGLSMEETADQTVDLTKRAADLASVFNVEVSEATTALGAALRGESEPARRFGINISDAAIQAEALASGLVKSKNEITDQIKVQARLALIYKQSADVAGDFENTSDGLANQSRILKANFADLGAELGRAFIPATENAVGALATLVAGLKDAAVQARQTREALDLVYGRDSGADLSAADRLAGLRRGYEELTDRANTLRETIENNRNGTERWQAAVVEQSKTALDGILQQRSALERQIAGVARLAEEERLRAEAAKTASEENVVAAETQIAATEEIEEVERNLWSQRSDWIERWRERQISVAEEVARVNEENAAKIQASYENAFMFAGNAISDLTFALASGEEAYKAFAKVGLNALAELLGALGAKLAAIAAEGLALSFLPPFTGGGAVGPALAGSAAAFAASGAVRAAASSFQEGTPVNQPFTVPGTPGRDSQPIMVEPGEEVTVNSRARSARGGAQMANITLNIDGRAFGKLILDLSRDRVVTLDRGALVAT